MTAIVNPVKNRNSPQLGPVAVMAATQPDFKDLRAALAMDGQRQRPLYMSRLCLPDKGHGPCLAGPMIGAPYAVMVMETLIAWGAKTFLFLGWCGAISPQVRTGDIVLPTGGMIDEGTSPHYGMAGGQIARPSAPLVKKVSALLETLDVPWHAGHVWTTDAIYRETEAAVRRHQGQGVLAVEMETSALFAAAAFRGVEVVSLLVVSDELSSLTWCPGFKDSRFVDSRRTLVTALAAFLSDPEAGES
ncbi:MAG: nucleoside phosphorylase [Desulfobacterales bacterium]|nr:nucleoside phosphorylase [Desulfobacterales bacterium]